MVVQTRTMIPVMDVQKRTASLQSEKFFGETWLYNYTFEIKEHSKQLTQNGSPPPKKAKMVL